VEAVQYGLEEAVQHLFVCFAAPANSENSAVYWHDFLGVFLLITNPYSEVQICTFFWARKPRHISDIGGCTVRTDCTGNQFLISDCVTMDLYVVFVQ
jgi:hypothetical protein